MLTLWYKILLIRRRISQIQGIGPFDLAEAIKVADKAQVKQTLLFHHDPSNDDKMDQIAKAAAVRDGGSSGGEEEISL